MSLQKTRIGIRLKTTVYHACVLFFSCPIYVDISLFFLIHLSHFSATSYTYVHPGRYTRQVNTPTHACRFHCRIAQFWTNDISDYQNSDRKSCGTTISVPFFLFTLRTRKCGKKWEKFWPHASTCLRISMDQSRIARGKIKGKRLRIAIDGRK